MKNVFILMCNYIPSEGAETDYAVAVYSTREGARQALINRLYEERNEGAVIKGIYRAAINPDTKDVRRYYINTVPMNE